MLNVIYEDRDILVVEKPAGIESQNGRGFEPDMVSEIKNYLKREKLSRLSTEKSTKPSTREPEPYVGVIHRLDRHVGGVMVYAKNQKAAASLSREIREGRIKKIYHAAVCGKIVDIVGNYVDYLVKDGKNNYSSVVDKGTANSKRAELSFRVLESCEEKQVSLVEIKLLTGRHHQIRAQFAAHGYPLWGDGKYNPDWGGTLPSGGANQGERDKRENPVGFGERELALFAVSLSFIHPATHKEMEFSIKPKGKAFEGFGER